MHLFLPPLYEFSKIYSGCPETFAADQRYSEKSEAPAHGAHRIGGVDCRANCHSNHHQYVLYDADDPGVGDGAETLMTL